MAARIQRWVVFTVMACAVFAGAAAHHNHTTKPCTDAQVGAGGMCVTVQIGGAA